MTGVQLIGVKAVLTGYEKFGTDAWALYQGKQFIVGGTGGESLADWLKSFEAAQSTATYTLRVYDSSEAPTSSTGAGDYIACVAFKLLDNYDGFGIGGYSNKLMDRIAALEKKKEEPDDEPDDDIGTIITGWFKNPEQLGMVVGAVRQLLGIGGPVQPAMISAIPVQTISGFGPTNNMATEDTLTRLSKAIDILEKCDPKLVEHLEKLAKLAQTEPLLFRGVISKLDAL